jgi:hypothetical protein
MTVEQGCAGRENAPGSSSKASHAFVRQMLVGSLHNPSDTGKDRRTVVAADLVSMTASWVNA